MLSLRYLPILLLLLGLTPWTATAQEDEEEQQLPDIAPREVEIRGELQLSFPSLERQPLTGFTTPTTVPSVPQNRTPYMEPYRQSLESLPESLPSPQPSAPSVATSKPSKQGLLEMGGGRYASRFVKGRLSLPLSDQQTLSIKTDYAGTEGFTPFPGSDVETPSDYLDGRIRLQSRHSDVRLQASIHGGLDSYTLYGVAPSTPPDRTGYDSGISGGLRTEGTVESTLDLAYNHTAYETELNGSDPTSAATFSEDRLSLDGSLTVPVEPLRPTFDLAASWSSLGGDVPSHQAGQVNAGLTVTTFEGDGTSLEAGGRVLHFDVPSDPTLAASPSARATFILPHARAELELESDFTVYAKNIPSMTGGDLSSIYREAPYVSHAPSPRPTLTTTDAEAGLYLTVGPVRLQTQAGYRYAPSYAHVRPSESTSPRNGRLDLDHQSARIIHGGGEAVLQGTDAVEVSAGLSVRDGALVGNGEVIPYFSPFVADAMFAFSFADQDGYLQTTGTVEAPRPVDQSGQDELDTFVSFDFEGSYAVTSLIDAVLRIENISPQPPEKWARYPHPPATVMGGLRIHW